MDVPRLDGLMPSTPEAGKPRSLNGSSLKRKAGYDSPAVSKINNEPQTPQRTASTPHGVPDGVADTPKYATSTKLQLKTTAYRATQT